MKGADIISIQENREETRNYRPIIKVTSCQQNTHYIIKDVVIVNYNMIRQCHCDFINLRVGENRFSGCYISRIHF